MSITSERLSIGIERHFTIPGVHPYDAVEWERRHALIADASTGVAVFEQPDVEFPAFWSQNAVNIVSQKYFRGRLGAPERESSLRQVIDRVVCTIACWGGEDGYFSSVEEADTFAAELTYLLLHQQAAFNSPVWFNIGVPEVPQQSSACFILSVEDDMESILDWYREEGMIFKRGSGSGVNLSNIRSSQEHLSGGGRPSGPVSFMRGADASAGAIRSGGTTRRAAKMVVLDADHPDIEEFIWCKAHEEKKARALAEAGFDMSFDGADGATVFYQNANNSVRLSDAFMRAALEGLDWELTARTTGEVLSKVPAAGLLRQIAEATWSCADPGVQFDTQINRWHTTPADGRITASNPCSEYLHIDDSACNLASLNLLSFLSEDGRFDVRSFRSAVRVVFCAQEILVGRSHYPTDSIAINTRKFRQLGLGYTNLGAMLMSMGLPYDSAAGRANAAAVTAVMCGEAYLTSALMAARMSSFAGFRANRSHVLRVLDMHRKAVSGIAAEHVSDDLMSAAADAWNRACSLALKTGVRNAQATVLAPTGTISFMMDCDTTGIEPDLALRKTKALVGGGSLTLLNRSVRRALAHLGYSEAESDEIAGFVETHGSVIGAPHLAKPHQEVFACSIGDNVVGPVGHVKMMAAVQPFLSGGISKTVNVGEQTTIEEIEDLLVAAWRQGVKAIAVYRDNSKWTQPMSASIAGGTGGVEASEALPEPVRRELPRERRSRTLSFKVADCKGYVIVGEYPDGRPGEIFVKVSKQGSTLAGIMDAFAIAISHGLQYGVPLRSFVDAYRGMRFEPAGITDDPDIRIATSLIDYLFRRLGLIYLSAEERESMGLFTADSRPSLPDAWAAAVQALDIVPGSSSGAGNGYAWELSARSRRADAAAPLCMTCGTQMVRVGSCYACATCGATSGCG